MTKAFHMFHFLMNKASLMFAFLKDIALSLHVLRFFIKKAFHMFPFLIYKHARRDEQRFHLFFFRMNKPFRVFSSSSRKLCMFPPYLMDKHAHMFPSAMNKGSAYFLFT